MGEFLKILIWLTAGIFLLWLGYTLFIGRFSPFKSIFVSKKKKHERDSLVGEPGDPQVCLVCSMKLVRGNLVQTTAFPSVSGGIDRLMYVRGCNICLNGSAQRSCPVCQSILNLDDYLVARMFERSEKRKNHVHVLGCNHCRKTSELKR